MRSRPMDKVAIVTALALIGAVLPGFASALTLEEIVAPTPWSNTVGGINVQANTVEADPRGRQRPGELQVGWGAPSALGEFAGRSRLGFSPLVAVPELPLDGTLFELGLLRHFNFTVAAGSAMQTTDLIIDLLFSDPGIDPDPITVTFAINETPNQPCGFPALPGCDDIISFMTRPNEPLVIAEFSVGATTYVLELLGFADPSHLGNVLAELITPEGEISEALLVAQVRVIPTPGALVLLGGALLGATAIARFLRRG